MIYAPIVSVAVPLPLGEGLGKGEFNEFFLAITLSRGSNSAFP
jgi:hypothetical protein